MEKPVKRIVCVHLLNNYTGSPKVLAQVIRQLQQQGYGIDLITSRGDGFLSYLPEVQYHWFNYRWSENKVRTLLDYLRAQISMFLILLRYYRNEEVVVYINTLLPWGAALAGKLMKKEVVYHVHENYNKSDCLSRFNLKFFTFAATKAIYVSDYVKNCYRGVALPGKRIYNALEEEMMPMQRSGAEYMQSAAPDSRHDSQSAAADPAWSTTRTSAAADSSVLLIAALRAYKGIYQFLKLSELMPERRFELVLSASQEEVDRFCAKSVAGANVKVYAAQTDLRPFYRRAGMLLNLTLPDQCVETFGLTILEAMAHGVPAIVPPVGGPVELVTDGWNGFQVDGRNIEELKEKIERLFSSPELYHLFSERAVARASEFKLSVFTEQLMQVLNENSSQPNNTLSC
jgi:glycosyltransferase involved in cell wall biosynthesis